MALGIRVQVLSFNVGFMVQSLGFRVRSLGLEVIEGWGVGVGFRAGD